VKTAAGGSTCSKRVAKEKGRLVAGRQKKTGMLIVRHRRVRAWRRADMAHQHIEISAAIISMKYRRMA